MLKINLQLFGGRGGGSSMSGGAVDYTRASDFDYSLFNKLPKSLQVKNITDIGKDRTMDGTRYRAVIQFDDGYTRSIGEYTLADFKYYVKQILTNDRTIEM